MLLLVSFVLDGRHPFVGWGERGDGCSVPTTKWLWAAWSSGWETSCLSDHLLPENDQAPPVWSHLLSGCQAGVEQTRRKTCWYGSTYQLPEAYIVMAGVGISGFNGDAELSLMCFGDSAPSV